MKPFPMPNEMVDDRTVVASTYYTDEIALVLLLNREPPFFTVAHYDLTTGSVVSLAREENIVYAVREYEQSGGDV